VAVARALLGRGRDVLMLDGGKALEGDRVAARDRLAAIDPARWTDQDRAAWQRPQFATPAGQVRRYGSDFAMEAGSVTYEAGSDTFALRASRATGGLSNLWGSAVLPYRSADMAGWPISAADLQPHYQAVAAFLPVAARNDDLAALFPAFDLAGSAPLASGAQGAALVSGLDRSRTRLAALGMTAGQARQAVRSGCRACGQCLHGCPWGLIWSAGAEVAALRADARFSFQPGEVVRAFTESRDGVSLHLASGRTLAASRLFVAAGVLETARILLASQPDRKCLTLHDSHHGFLPSLMLHPPAKQGVTGYQTLAQAFLELDAPAISPYLIHAQLYGWNEFYERDLIAAYGRRLPGSAPLWRALARRLIVAQIFLHSDHSASADLSLAPDGRLRATVTPNPGTNATFQAAARTIGKGLRGAGLLPLTFAARQNPPGSSFHVGASLPMARAPGRNTSDLLGRPDGLTRVHVVDASVLPAIPATTITFPVMANAHRIGALCP
jgi:choline dehydrogenase-like flavoprotein